MMHGRAGPYSSAANGRYDATTLSKRHAFWGRYWAAQGYVALLVDGFGPRGRRGKDCARKRQHDGGAAIDLAHPQSLADF